MPLAAMPSGGSEAAGEDIGVWEQQQARLATEQAEGAGAAASSRGASEDGSSRASSAATSVQARWRGGAARQAQRDAVAAELEHIEDQLQSDQERRRRFPP